MTQSHGDSLLYRGNGRPPAGRHALTTPAFALANIHSTDSRESGVESPAPHKYGILDGRKGERAGFVKDSGGQPKKTDVTIGPVTRSHP
jgi:hypothetical protein